MIIKEIMTIDVHTLSPSDSLKNALQLFAEYNVHGAPVVDNNDKLVGIFAESDLLDILQKKSKHLQMRMSSLPIASVTFVESENPEKLKDIFKKVLKMKVKEVMSTNVHHLGPDDKVKAVVDLMNNNDITRVPVCKDGKLVGIVTRQDIIKIGLPYKK
jgi:CBS domain-containing protein